VLTSRSTVCKIAQNSFILYHYYEGRRERTEGREGTKTEMREKENNGTEEKGRQEREREGETGKENGRGGRGQEHKGGRGVRG